MTGLTNYNGCFIVFLSIYLWTCDIVDASDKLHSFGRNFTWATSLKLSDEAEFAETECKREQS